MYVGDCTRCVVNGEVPPIIESMHAAIVDAKAAATAATIAGVTGEQVHEATLGRIHAQWLTDHEENVLAEKLLERVHIWRDEVLLVEANFDDKFLDV